MNYIYFLVERGGSKECMQMKKLIGICSTEIFMSILRNKRADKKLQRKNGALVHQHKHSTYRYRAQNPSLAILPQLKTKKKLDLSKGSSPSSDIPPSQPDSVP